MKDYRCHLRHPFTHRLHADSFLLAFLHILLMLPVFPSCLPRFTSAFSLPSFRIDQYRVFSFRHFRQRINRAASVSTFFLQISLLTVLLRTSDHIRLLRYSLFAASVSSIVSSFSSSRLFTSATNKSIIGTNIFFSSMV